MPLSWNEIKNRALAFSKTWENECCEDAEAKSSKRKIIRIAASGPDLAKT